MKDRKGPGCKTAPGSMCKGVPRADPSVPPVLAREPLILVAFPCCITSLPLLYPSSVFSPGTLKSQRVGIQLGNTGGRC